MNTDQIIETIEDKLTRWILAKQIKASKEAIYKLLPIDQSVEEIKKNFARKISIYNSAFFDGADVNVYAMPKEYMIAYANGLNTICGRPNLINANVSYFQSGDDARKMATANNCPAPETVKPLIDASFVPNSKTLSDMITKTNADIEQLSRKVNDEDLATFKLTYLPTTNLITSFNDDTSREYIKISEEYDMLRQQIEKDRNKNSIRDRIEESYSDEIHDKKTINSDFAVKVCENAKKELLELKSTQQSNAEASSRKK